MSITPPKAANAATRTSIRSDRLPAGASRPKNAAETERAATKGHDPASGWSGERQEEAIATPEDGAMPITEERGSGASARRLGLRDRLPADDTISRMPSPIKSTAKETGRSPSTTETTTGW